MIDLDALKTERVKLTIRNQEIKKLKESSGAATLYEEEKTNRERIREITQVIRNNR
jgi:hypothetical protein